MKQPKPELLIVWVGKRQYNVTIRFKFGGEGALKVRDDLG